MSYKVLIVDDEKSLVLLLTEIATQLGFEIITASNGEDAVNLAFTEHPDMIFMDIHMPIMDGMQALDLLKKAIPETPVVLITAFGTVDIAMEAIQKGAFEYLVKPSNVDEIRSVFKKIAQLLDAKNNSNKEPVVKTIASDIVGVSAAIQNLFKTVSKIAKTDTSVLITGESGSGKQLVAKALHRLSNRKDQPFIHINCGSLPETLIESELFGHEKGAFTGADNIKKGRFELADKGTIFLDEVAELPLVSQVKILRVLQEREIERLGSTHTIKLDVRVIAATNRDLKAMVDNGLFRLDLYHRLKVIHTHVPPLRERVEDIPILIDHFVNIFTKKYNIERPLVTDAFYNWAKRNSWHGNTRELINIIERIIVLSNGIIDISDLDNIDNQYIKSNNLTIKKECLEAILTLGDLKKMLSYVESKIIDVTLERNNQNRSHTAKSLGISRRALLYKLKEEDTVL